MFKEGKSFAQFPFRVYYHLSDSVTPATQFGVSVSTKLFKRAVDRNRVKRLIREAYRLQKLELKDWSISNSKQLLVFFIYTGKTLPDYGEVYDKTGKLLKKLNNILTNKQ